jgi:hypothetical protein
LLGRAFAAVGPAPSWAHLESVVAALKRSGDPAAAALLSRAAEGQPDAMDEVRMIAFANGSSQMDALDVIAEWASGPGAMGAGTGHRPRVPSGQPRNPNHGGDRSGGTAGRAHACGLR